MSPAYKWQIVGLFSHHNHGRQFLIINLFYISLRNIYIYIYAYISRGSPGGASGKESPANAGDARNMGLIPGLGRSPGAETGNPLQYSCLESSIDRVAWWATVHGVTKSQNMTEQLNAHTHTQAHTHRHKRILLILFLCCCC